MAVAVAAAAAAATATAAVAEGKWVGVAGWVRARGGGGAGREWKWVGVVGGGRGLGPGSGWRRVRGAVRKCAGVGGGFEIGQRPGGEPGLGSGPDSESGQRRGRSETRGRVGAWTRAGDASRCAARPKDRAGLGSGPGLWQRPRSAGAGRAGSGFSQGEAVREERATGGPGPRQRDCRCGTARASVQGGPSSRSGLIAAVSPCRS